MESAKFLSTLSLRRATQEQRHYQHCLPISIHALLAESDCQPCDRRNPLFNFYPRSPCGERQANPSLYDPARTISIHALLAESDKPCRWSISACRNFYPRSPCGERRSNSARSTSPGRISIHALLAESDRQPAQLLHKPRMISIHALLAESDVFHFVHAHNVIGFLSTLSLRRATWLLHRVHTQRRNFYPRSPCGERPSRRRVSGSNSAFLSTLSLRRATVPKGQRSVQLQFLSTLSLRRATLIRYRISAR